MTPGFHSDIPEATYHADRGGLSVSGAKVLLKAPALFRWQQENGRADKPHFDIGHAAHGLVLGVSDPLYVAPFDNWMTKQAKLERDLARAEGMVPILPSDYETVAAMADKLSEHRLAMELLSKGEPEVSAYAIDEPTGVMRRGRFDWLGPVILTDYKTAASSEPGAFASSAAKFGYHMQAGWYLDLARDLGHPAEAFAFIVQEKEPPYLVTVVELDDDAVNLGRARNREALERFRDCTEADRWPGYITDDQIARVSLPRWAYYTDETETA